MDILLVDDDRVDREILIRGIRQHDLSSNIIEVSTGNAALKAFDQQHFDVVFLDYKLACDCGIELLEQMRSHPQKHQSAIIMMSGCEAEEVAISAIRKGAQDLIIKNEINGAGLRRCITHSKARVDYEDEIYQLKSKSRKLMDLERFNDRQLASVKQ